MLIDSRVGATYSSMPGDGCAKQPVASGVAVCRKPAVVALGGMLVGISLVAAFYMHGIDTRFHSNATQLIQITYFLSQHVLSRCFHLQGFSNLPAS